MVVGSLSSFHVQRSPEPVQCEHFAKRRVVLPSQLVTLGQLHFLRWIAISMNGAACRLALLAEKGPQFADMFKPCDSLRLVEQILFRQLSQTEEFPPLSLLLAMMPVDQVREQPPHMVVMYRLAGLRLHTLEHPFTECDRASRPLAWLILWFLFQNQSRNADAVPNLLGAETLQPVSQVKRRLDVFTVVRLDDVTRLREDGGWIMRLQRHLDRDPAT